MKISEVSQESVLDAFDAAPNEIIVNIFLNCVSTDYGALDLTCRRFHQILTDNRSWATIFYCDKARNEGYLYHLLPAYILGKVNYPAIATYFRVIRTLKNKEDQDNLYCFFKKFYTQISKKIFENKDYELTSHYIKALDHYWILNQDMPEFLTDTLKTMVRTQAVENPSLVTQYKRFVIDGHKVRMSFGQKYNMYHGLLKLLIFLAKKGIDLKAYIDDELIKLLDAEDLVILLFYNTCHQNMPCIDYIVKMEKHQKKKAAEYLIELYLDRDDNINLAELFRYEFINRYKEKSRLLEFLKKAIHKRSYKCIDCLLSFFDSDQEIILRAILKLTDKKSVGWNLIKNSIKHNLKTPLDWALEFKNYKAALKMAGFAPNLVVAEQIVIKTLVHFLDNSPNRGKKIRSFIHACLSFRPKLQPLFITSVIYACLNHSKKSIPIILKIARNFLNDDSLKIWQIVTIVVSSSKHHEVLVPYLFDLISEIEDPKRKDNVIMSFLKPLCEKESCSNNSEIKNLHTKIRMKYFAQFARLLSEESQLEAFQLSFKEWGRMDLAAIPKFKTRALVKNLS